ncbi:MAG: MutT/nudix family protein [Candidatus Pacebacteria bacterium GW2011_GWB1_47_8]|nr:MAG: MutT/nudix family protein [Candidatus Pacebacteria bacterium GW2011_GWA1_46_10]KKU84536.1 MAG: MutT/nudix family protein [Candidatus Pacebacteria bacterium GW2011_GWB1_47_8]
MTMTTQYSTQPQVGVAVMIIRDRKILLGKRLTSHGTGTWHLPGGHLEFMETVEDCARREVLEETGLEIENVELGPYTNDFFVKENKHYITLFVLCTAKGKPRAMEPEKCVEWKWFEWDNLPKPLFLSVENLIKSGFSL